MDISHCARPGCGAPAAAALTYDYGNRTVWLADLDRGGESGLWGMCSTHADGLRVPRGWSFEDQRSTVIPFRSQLAV